MQFSRQLRNLAERLSRGVVLRRHLPDEFHRLPLFVTPEAGLRHWLTLSRVDPHLFRMARELVGPGAIVWDVGANIGLFAFTAAARAGASGFVLAIEPDIWLAGLLDRSARMIARKTLNAAPVKVLCASASAQTRIADLEIAERARASNHLRGISGSTQTGGGRQRQPTVSLSLDFLLSSFPAPQVLKIDVESHELEVLQGALNLLKNNRPIIWIEVDPSNAIAVSELLQAHHYQLFGAALDPHPPIARAWWNTLAVPAKRPANVVDAESDRSARLKSA